MSYISLGAILFPELLRKDKKPFILFCQPHCILLKYAGRLDKQSRGLVALSDDGFFIQSLTHARFQTPKYYRVALNRIPEDFENWTELLCKKGVLYENTLLRADQLKLLTSHTKRKWIEIVLREGRKRHIRRMMAALDIEVLDLYRYAIGNLSIAELALAEKKHKAVSPHCFFPKDGSPL